jgi:hypothetical protein
MKNKELHAIAQAAAKNIKSEADLNEFRQMLTKITVEAALNAELDEHLGFSRHEQSEGENHRNGYSRKTLQTECGQFELDTPRDRSGSFEPPASEKTSTPFHIDGRQNSLPLRPRYEHARNRRHSKVLFLIYRNIVN